MKPFKHAKSAAKARDTALECIEQNRRNKIDSITTGQFLNAHDIVSIIKEADTATLKDDVLTLRFSKCKTKTLEMVFQTSDTVFCSRCNDIIEWKDQTNISSWDKVRDNCSFNREWRKQKLGQVEVMEEIVIYDMLDRPAYEIRATELMTTRGAIDVGSILRASTTRIARDMAKYEG